MSPLEQLQSILYESYLSEDEIEYKVKLKPGLSDQQIDQMVKALPNSRIPPDIRDLLHFASGFEFYSPDGKWNCVFYVCHDPAVVVNHSNNLAEFINHIDEFGKKGKGSNLDIIHERTVMDIWETNDGFMDIANAWESSDRTLGEFALGLPDHFVVADLRNKLNKAGFAWGKFGPHVDKAVRHQTELIWGFEKGSKQSKLDKPVPQNKKGIFSRLFGR